MEVILYTIHCPKCIILEKKLTMKKIPFTIVDDEDEMIKKGIRRSPVLSVDGVLYEEMSDANNWINNYGGEK